MADCQTTGGYPKFAVVIFPDLPLAAQLMPGSSIGFGIVEVSEAQALARKQWAQLNAELSPV